MNACADKINEKQNLIFRKLKSKDFERVALLLQNQQVMQFLGPGRPLDATEIQIWIDSFLERQRTGCSRKVVALKKTDDLIGICGVLVDAQTYDFGVYFLPDHWGKGYAYQACAALLPDAQATYGKELIFFVHKDNASSHQLAIRLGLQVNHEGFHLGYFGSFYSK